MTDFIVTDHGTTAMIRPQTDAARQLVSEGAFGDGPMLGNAVACEPRMVEGVMFQLQEDGYEVDYG